VDRIQELRRARVVVAQDEMARSSALLAGIQAVRLFIESCAQVQAAMLGMFHDMDKFSDQVTGIRAVYTHLLDATSRYVLRVLFVVGALFVPNLTLCPPASLRFADTNQCERYPSRRLCVCRPPLLPVPSRTLGPPWNRRAGREWIALLRLRPPG